MSFYKIILIIIILFSSSCTPPKSFQQSFFAFDTLITITIVDHKMNNNQFDIIMKDFKKKAQDYDLLFNNYNKKSEVFKINQFKPGRFYKIDTMLFDLLIKCKKYFYLTEGAFDITIGNISRLYDYNNKKIPSKDNVRIKLKSIGMKNIILSNNQIKLLKDDMSIDLGGVAKGYIIDRFSEFIKSKGYNNFLVNIGGDIYASGCNQKRKKWVIGIQHPRIKQKVIAKVNVSDQSIVTSGDYERYILRKKKKYHHILNPKTGLPIWNNIVSVTVIAEKAVVADYIATAMFVMGVENAKKFVNGNYRGKVEYYIVIEDKDRLEVIKN